MKIKILIPLLAGMAMLWACKGRGRSEAADTASTIPNETVLHKSAITDTAQKLVKKADVDFQVKNVQQTTEHIAALAQSYSGTVVHHIMGSTAGKTENIRLSNDSTLRVTVYNTTAEMIVRIPPAKMEDFINQVARMGIHVNNLKMDIEDKSIEYQIARLKLKNRTDAAKKHEKAANNINNSDDLNYKDALIDRQATNRKTDDSVKNSTVSLSFYESNAIQKVIVANDDFSAYNLPVYKRIGMSLEYGWGLFVDVLVALINAWVLLPLGLCVWLAFRYVNKKRTSAGLIKT